MCSSDLETVGGGLVDLVRQAEFPWIGLRRQVKGVRAARVPMVIEQEDPPATLAAPEDVQMPDAPASAAPLGSATAASSSGGAPEVISQLPQPLDHSLKRDMMETTRRGPAPVALSDESRLPRSVKVPDGPTASEKEMHYLPHIPFRSWCSYCTRGCAPENPHNRDKGDVEALS